VPATATTRGSATFYFDGVKGPNTITWNQYNPANAKATPVAGSTAYSFLDANHLGLIIGTGSKKPDDGLRRVGLAGFGDP
jgi:hypothetical protein